MRVRTGFVSNSSSTSFLILTAEELTEDAFLELMGVSRDSPLAQIFVGLYERIMDGAEVAEVDSHGFPFLPERWFGNSQLRAALDARLAEARSKGLIAYFGALGSDGDPIESLLCTESFEAENERIYFNCLSSSW
jgi:hypothetical protein